MNGLALKITPQTGAHPGGELYQGIDQGAYQQRGHAQIDQQPKSRLPGVARLWNAVPHDGFHLGALEKSGPHGLILTNWSAGR
jgi:hypothetical protein